MIVPVATMHIAVRTRTTCVTSYSLSRIRKLARKSTHPKKPMCGPIFMVTRTPNHQPSTFNHQPLLFHSALYIPTPHHSINPPLQSPSVRVTKEQPLYIEDHVVRSTPGPPLRNGDPTAAGPASAGASSPQTEFYFCFTAGFGIVNSATCCRFVPSAADSEKRKTSVFVSWGMSEYSGQEMSRRKCLPSALEAVAPLRTVHILLPRS